MVGAMAKMKQNKKTAKTPTITTSKLRDMPLRLVLPVKEEYGGHIEALGTVGEITSLAKMVHSKGLGIEGSLQLIHFAIRLWTVISQRPEPERVFDEVWQQIFQLFPHNIDWDKPADRWLAVTYVLLSHKPPLLTYPKAAKLVSEELGKSFTANAWRMRLGRFANRHTLPGIDIYEPHTERGISG